MGLAPLQPGQAHVQPGLICLDRAVPYQTGVMARALQMSMGSRLGSCDPLAFTVRPRDLPVQRRPEFHSNIWPSAVMLVEDTHYRGFRLLTPSATRSTDPPFPRSHHPPT